MTPQSAGLIDGQRKLLSLIAPNGRVSKVCRILRTLHSKTNSAGLSTYVI